MDSEIIINGGMDMSDFIMNINNIEKTFQNTKAVDQVSFKVKKGEVLGLLGPNGAGKTTTIRMIMDIIQPDQGEIILNKDLITNQKQIGYLPEERGIYDTTKVFDTILYFADLKGMKMDKAKKEADKWLELFDLNEYKNNKIEDLSRGMQQKVQFIISVIHKPKLLILDEVFSGLDPVNQELFKDIIRDLTKNGTTILLSSHRMNLVEEVCSRIFMINRGRRVLYGKIDDIKNEENEVSFNIKSNINIKDFLSFISEKIEVEEISIVKPPLHEIFVHAAKGGNQ